MDPYVKLEQAIFLPPIPLTVHPRNRSHVIVKFVVKAVSGLQPLSSDGPRVNVNVISLGSEVEGIAPLSGDHTIRVVREANSDQRNSQRC